MQSVDNKTAVREQFQVHLNATVEEDNWIDATFVLDLTSSFVTHSSLTKEGEHPDLVETLKKGGSAADIARVISGKTEKGLGAFGQKCGRGTFDSMIFRFSKGILNMYIHTPKTISFAIGFVNASSDGLGGMLPYCEEYAVEIREFLDKLYG